MATTTWHLNCNDSVAAPTPRHNHHITPCPLPRVGGDSNDGDTHQEAPFDPTNTLGIGSGWALPGTATLLDHCPTPYHIYFEHQRRALCAVHAINMFLQAPAATERSMASLAEDMSCTASATEHRPLWDRHGNFDPSVITAWLGHHAQITTTTHCVASPSLLADHVANTDRAILLTHRHATVICRLRGITYILDPEAGCPTVMHSLDDLDDVYAQGVHAIITAHSCPVDLDSPTAPYYCHDETTAVDAAPDETPTVRPCTGAVVMPDTSQCTDTGGATDTVTAIDVTAATPDLIGTGAGVVPDSYSPSTGTGVMSNVCLRGTGTGCDTAIETAIDVTAVVPDLICTDAGGMANTYLPSTGAGVVPNVCLLGTSTGNVTAIETVACMTTADGSPSVTGTDQSTKPPSTTATDTVTYSDPGDDRDPDMPTLCGVNSDTDTDSDCPPSLTDRDTDTETESDSEQPSTDHPHGTVRTRAHRARTILSDSDTDPDLAHPTTGKQAAQDQRATHNDPDTDPDLPSLQPSDVESSSESDTDSDQPSARDSLNTVRARAHRARTISSDSDSDTDKGTDLPPAVSDTATSLNHTASSGVRPPSALTTPEPTKSHHTLLRPVALDHAHRPKQAPRRSPSRAPTDIVHDMQSGRLWDIGHVVEVLRRWKSLDPPPETEDPIHVNGWVGSCFDSSAPAQGHIRWSHLNPRTLGVTPTKGSRDVHETMWKTLARLHVSCAHFADTALIDPTPLDPMSSLKKTRTMAKFSWGQRNSTLTHGQGLEGTLRPAVGGTMVATDDAVSRILGVAIEDPRGWGRFTGRILVGKEGFTTVSMAAYFPCTASKDSPGSAWQTQAALMKDIPAEERLSDPWFQCLADLQRVLWLLLHEGASPTVLEKRTIILSADFNARWVNPKPEGSPSQKRTRSLRAFAQLLGLAEPMSFLHPSARPLTYYKSTEPGAQTSCIDFFLVSSTILEQGIVMEAGVLQHEQINNSDHRLCVIDVHLDALLHLGDGWHQPEAASDPKLQKLPLRCPKSSSAFQCRATELWKKNNGQTCIREAVDAVAAWSADRDHAADDAGTSDWGTVDPTILAHLDAVFETLVSVTVGAWRSAQNCLPAYQQMGSHRKDGWSPECVKKMRNLRCLLDVASLWQRGTCSREDILQRVSSLVDMPNTKHSAPDANADHVRWRQWVAHVKSRIPVVRGELHGVNRKLMQEVMLEAAERRNAKWDSGQRRQCIANWIQRSRGSGPMKSTIVKDADGQAELILGEGPLRGCLDTRFSHWMSERLFQQTPLDTFWYEANGGHLLASPTPEGRALRVRAAEGKLTADDWSSIPDRYHTVVVHARAKYLESLEGPITPAHYPKCMQHISDSIWHAYWANNKKGTAPGSTQMSVNMVWSLQMDIDHSTNAEQAKKHLPPGSAQGEKVCLTWHIFDAMRTFVNLIITTGIIPTRLLAEVLYPLDKVDGLINIENKRPIGLVEVLIQAVFGLQFTLVEDSWDEHSTLSTVQCGYTRKKTCEFPVMDITVKAEYAYIHKTFLAILWMDQSKAFDTLHLYLGIEMPLRRLGLPEKLITMTVNAKYGSWCMVATVHGPTESDWQDLVSTPGTGPNKLLPDPNCKDPVYGFDPGRGTTQGSKHGPSVFKGYYDWKVCIQSALGIEFAPFLDSRGNVCRSLGNALADDSNYTNSTIRGSLRALELASMFFAFMGGCLNLDKTQLTIVDWCCNPDGSCTGKYKVLCPDGVDWDSAIHLPATVQVDDPRALDRIETTTALLTAVKSDHDHQARLEWTQTLNGQSYAQMIDSLENRLANLERCRCATIRVLAPDDAVKYLGVWLPASLRYNTALSEARTEITTIAECLQCASITPSQMTEVVRVTAMQVGSWRLRMTSLFPEQLQGVDSRLSVVVKHKMHVCSSHPNLAFAASMHVTLSNQILVDRATMFLRMVGARHTISEAMLGSLWLLQRWIGSNTPALEYEHVELMGWSGTWIGSLAICMRRQNLSIVGGKGIPLVRMGDACLVDLVPVEKKPTMALGCWSLSVWRLSDLVNLGGSRVSDFASSLWARHPDWLTLVYDTVSEWESEEDNSLGPWLSDDIADRRYLAMRNHDALRLDLVRVVDTCDGMLHCVQLQRICRRRMTRHSLSSGETMDEWLELTGGSHCSCTDEDTHCTSCFVWADTSHDTGLTMVKVPAAELLPVAFSVREGTLCGHTGAVEAKFVVIDEEAPLTCTATLTPTTQIGLLTGVDTITLLGTSFEDREVSEWTRERRCTAWSTAVTALWTGAILYTYTDCSLITKDGITKLAYGWVTGGTSDPDILTDDGPDKWPSLDATKKDFSLLVRGAWGGGIVSGPQSDMSTSRGEAFGVLAMMVHVTELLSDGLIPPTTRVWSFCDNKGVCDRFNTDPDVHGEYDVGIDPDLWALMLALKTRLRGNFRLTWQRSHPERRKQRAAYHRHNWGNLWSDVLADRAMEVLHGSDKRPYLGPALVWGIKWGDELITKDIRKTMKKALMSESFLQYLQHSRGWDPEVLQGFPKERWFSKLDVLSDAATAVVLNKMITGWLATLTVQAKRSTDTTFDTSCRLCKLTKETNWHVLAECTHPAMVKTRRCLMSKILDHIKALPLPAGIKKLVSLNWLVSNDGTLVEMNSDSQLADVIRNWAPELADTITDIDLRHQLLWDTPHGIHGDDLRKWAFRGVLPAQWDHLLLSHGVSQPVATASLLGIEKLVCQTSPELWREFCAQVHDAGRGRRQRTDRAHPYGTGLD